MKCPKCGSEDVQITYAAFQDCFCDSCKTKWRPWQHAIIDRQRKAIEKALDEIEGVLALISDSSGVSGYHLNGEIANWDEVIDVDELASTIKMLKETYG